MSSDDYKRGFRAGYLAAIAVLRKELAIEKIRTEFELNTLQGEVDDIRRMILDELPQVRH